MVIASLEAWLQPRTGPFHLNSPIQKWECCCKSEVKHQDHNLYKLLRGAGGARKGRHVMLGGCLKGGFGGLACDQ